MSNSTDVQSTESRGRLWLSFALVAAAVVAVAALWWAHSHPFGTNWDETSYLDELAIDRQGLRAGRLLHLCARLLLGDGARPPAYRLLALPLVSLFAFHPFIARLTTLACSALAAWFIYRATRRVAGQAAAAFAVLVFCLCPQVVSASMWFSTEGPLYLATAAMLYYLFALWTERGRQRNNWIGLGLALALGLLSKSSFLAIGVPAVGFAFVLAQVRKPERSSRAALRNASLLALLLAGPWWLLNFRSAKQYAGIARDFVRHSLGSPSPATWVHWLESVARGLLGYGLSIVILLLAMSCIAFLSRKQRVLTPLQKIACAACVCAGLPMVLEQLSGPNDLLRHITPAVIPLAIILGILAESMGWTERRAGIAAMSLLFAAQLVMIVGPALSPRQLQDVGMVNGTLPWRIMNLTDQWNWGQLKTVSDGCGVTSPAIAYLGDGRPYTAAAIKYPWAVAGNNVEVQWLWHYENGPIDWQKTMAAADRSDLVITAPAYVGQVSNSENLDNEHNAELARRLAEDPHFGKPVDLRMGRFARVTVLLFVNRNRPCHQQQQLASNVNALPGRAAR